MSDRLEDISTTLEYEFDYVNKTAFVFPEPGTQVWYWTDRSLKDSAISTKVIAVDKEKRLVKIPEYKWVPLWRISTPRNIQTHHFLATRYSEPKFYERALTYQELAAHMIDLEIVMRESIKNGAITTSGKALVTDIAGSKNKTFIIAIVDKNLLSEIDPEDPESYFELWDADIAFIPKAKYKKFKPMELSEALGMDSILLNDWSNPENWEEEIKNGRGS